MTENKIYNDIKEMLRHTPRTWLVTGAAGFIGSNLVEHLLLLDQKVIGLDNFSNGKQKNLDQVQAAVSTDQWARFSFVEGDIRDLAAGYAGGNHHQLLITKVFERRCNHANRNFNG